MAGAPKLEAFIKAAQYFVGIKESPDGSNRFTSAKGLEMSRLAGFGTGFAWCAAFVSACAQKAGVANRVIAKDTYAIQVQAKTVSKYGGKWIDGPLINGGKAVTPMRGDLITFGTSKCKGHSHAAHVGIVEYVSGGKVHTIEGNTGNACKRKSYSLGYSGINAYVRPDWARVGDDISGYLSGVTGVFTPLYQDKNDRHDMTMREVGYLDSNYKLSNTPSNINISVINYTTVLGGLYDMFAPAHTNQVQISTSKLTGNAKIAVDYFLKMGCSGSCATALAGCLQAYSVINPSYQIFRQNTTLYGIAAWDIFKLVEIKQRLGDTWNTNLSGQLEYFTYDIEQNFASIIPIIKLQPLNIDGVIKVVDTFMPVYNKHCNSGNYIALAKNNAKELFNNLVITQSTVIGNTTTLKDKNGKVLSAKKSVSIPTSVPQTGIIDDYTSYSAWFNRWNGKSPQKKLANIWKSQGYPCSKGVATIGGFYCVAVRPKFGSCGDVIVVTLANGKTFPAIICDEKGADAGSEWGHKKSGGKISVIEWERVKTKNGKIQTGTKFADVDKHGFGDWYGKRVVNITNYGKYADVKWS